MQNGLKRYGLKCFVCMCLVLFPSFAFAQQEENNKPDDYNVRISLLTCAPGTDPYSLYGHTAIRCRAENPHFDYVFNYGVFSFDQPFFIFRFVLGRTDYMSQPIPWEYFCHEYALSGRKVIEQELNLLPDEAKRIMQILITEAQPEHNTYRYDFFRNNCTTKVRDVLERGIEDEIVYAELEEGKGQTYRKMLHMYNQVEPWTSEGQDILLGAEVDTTLSPRATMFLPEWMMKYCEGAVLRDDMNNTRSLVWNTHEVVADGYPVITPFLPMSPVWAAWILFGVLLLIMGFEYLIHYQLWFVDIFVLGVQGIISILLLFLMLISSHPGVHHNWLILLFHPISFYGLVRTVKAAWKRERTLWHACNVVLIISFLVFSAWMPQEFGKIVLPLSLAILTRPVSYLLYYRK